jgi:uncharacterized protein involved in response to NO
MPPRTALALFGLGFRPFYLGASTFAALSIPAWLASYTGYWQTARVHLLWHMHEMVFGFAVAVVFGFLYTAVRNWTGLWTPRGRQLAAISGLWLLGRVAMLAWPGRIAAVLDLLFIPAALIPLVSVMLKSGKRSNLPLLFLPLLLFCTNLGFHLALLGWTAESPMTAIEAGLLVLAVLSTMMAGRVVPGFTKNMAPGSAPRSFAQLDKAGIGLIILSSLAWTAGLRGGAGAALLACAGLIQLCRLAYWQPARTANYPLLWILHLAFGWIGIGYLLLALSCLELCSVSTAMHAIAIGGMSSLVLGMMTRTTIGHTGRPMRAERNERLIFLAIQGAATVRVLANVLSPLRLALLLASGACWVLAFATFVWRFAPLLSQARIDQREG